MILRTLLTAALLLGAAAALAQEQVTPGQVKALKDKIASIDQWLNEAEQDRSSLERQLRNVEQEISQLTRERRELRGKIAAQEQNLAQLQQQEAELRRTLESQRKSLRQQVRAAWMEGDTPAIRVLLNEIDPDRIARTMTYYEYLSKDTVTRLEAFNRNLRELQRTEKDMLATRLRLGELEKGVAERQDKLEAGKAKRQQTLAALNKDINYRKNERQSLDADRKRLEKLLREVEQAIASIPAPNESKPFRALRNKLPWPAKGKVSRSFGETLAEGKLRHNGLLISTGNETDVRAVHYGRVVFANWLRGFGLITIIDHGDGYMSLYGHSSSLLTSPGDWVDAGEVIAISGQTGGTTEPAVYFEIRYKGKPDNPRRWLAGR
ncbi:peptidoglycan DD-metalloendopeptidase family protein [Marinobacter sp.]|uniref:murein hydrolase activator EnvC family protein n=1 Tax=Marinobacter sp. TaxID=50741 RepID=UPI00199DD843|nr:peptidoglycan DD-metalloendopeptidase family protein [Marinobacter sp.]MBD3657387.1 peptidoglycan DD-metalloendopeptidase family protein [Marinobacter sp.]